MLEGLKEEVLRANKELVSLGLVTLTWGNVSGIDRREGLVVIKPSGVPYEELTIDKLVVVDLQGGIKEGSCRPSSDTPTHLALYRGFPSVGGICHTHSLMACAFAQACREIPCFGTTHADNFSGSIPVTRFLSSEEVRSAYEEHTGTVILERFRNLSPDGIPAVLVAGHGPFTWGSNAHKAVEHSLVLEQVARIARDSLLLNPDLTELPAHISEKHYHRKHGPDAYYGQHKP